jgi:uncharacterized protein (TIGR03435 family)
MDTTRRRWIPAVILIAYSALALAWLGPCSGAAQAQTVGTVPQFEVASVKQNISETTESSLNHSLPGRFTATNVPLLFLLLDAYEINGHQLVGTPEWAQDKSYDVSGTYPVGSRPDLHEIHRMEQHLLTERFGLKLHPEQREIPAYDLVLAKKDGRLGPQIHTSSMDCSAWAANDRPKTTGASKSPVSPTGERPVCRLVTTRTWLSGGARTMQDLAGSLEAMMDRPVLDNTGLTGAFDMDLKWVRTDLHADADATASPSDAPSLLRAVEEQLGLKLVRHKEPLRVLVVDHIQEPTPN